MNLAATRTSGREPKTEIKPDLERARSQLSSRKDLPEFESKQR